MVAVIATMVAVIAAVFAAPMVATTIVGTGVVVGAGSGLSRRGVVRAVTANDVTRRIICAVLGVGDAGGAENKSGRRHQGDQHSAGS
ncbi:MAG: hypothetical protein ACXWDI_16865, partial [Nocardioides sp.]